MTATDPSSPTVAGPSPDSEAPITVVLADDHPAILAGLAANLTEHGFVILDSVLSVDEVLPSVARHRPSVLVLDGRFGDDKSSGIRLVPQLLECGVGIVLFSQFVAPSYIQKAYQAGVNALVSKQMPIESLVEAVTLASQGQHFFPPGVAEQIAHAALRKNPLDALNARERDFFARIARGQTIEQIAADTGLSFKTVANASSSLKKKLGLRRPSELTLLAIDLGIDLGS